MRAAVPEGVRVGITTGAWAVPDPGKRVELIRSWTVLPDHASVNWHEEGAEAVAEALLERGIGVEAGVWSGTDGARRFRAWPRARRVLRVLAEVTDTDPATAASTATALLRELGTTSRRPSCCTARTTAPGPSCARRPPWACPPGSAWRTY